MEIFEPNKRGVEKYRDMQMRRHNETHLLPADVFTKRMHKKQKERRRDKQMEGLWRECKIHSPGNELIFYSVALFFLFRRIESQSWSQNKNWYSGVVTELKIVAAYLTRNKIIPSEFQIVLMAFVLRRIAWFEMRSLPSCVCMIHTRVNLFERKKKRRRSHTLECR